MSLITDTGEYVSAATKASPPIAVTSASIAGMPLQEWVLIATLVYTVLQIASLIYNFVKKRRDGRE